MAQIDWKRQHRLDALQIEARSRRMEAEAACGTSAGVEYAEDLARINAEIEALGGTPEYPNKTAQVYTREYIQAREEEYAARGGCQPPR